jgi:uncharacterized protein
LTYVDTSVLVAYYCPEPLSARAESALQASGDLAISPLVEVELSSAVARKVRNRELRARDAVRILTTFQSHLDQGVYTRVGIDAGHFAKARGWISAFKVPLQTLDALHVAIAEMRGCSILTADAVLAKACAKLKVPVRVIR